MWNIQLMQFLVKKENNSKFYAVLISGLSCKRGGLRSYTYIVNKNCRLEILRDYALFFTKPNACFVIKTV